MTSPTVPVLGPSTVNRKWILEVNTGSSGSPTWTAVGGVMDFAPVTDSANWVDDSDFASGGYQSQAKTSTAWSATCTVRRGTAEGDPTTYDPGQEYLRDHAEGKVGPSNSVSVRFYEYDANDPTGAASPRQQAYTGSCGVEWAEQGGAYNVLSTVQVTLQGQGKLQSITHPFPAA